MPQTKHQRAASGQVSAWLAHNERNIAWLADKAEVDPGTVGDFLNGSRWPKVRTQGRLEKALGWPAGTIHQIAQGAQVSPPMDLPSDTVGGSAQDADVEEETLLYRRPDGLTDQEWERVKLESREFIEWQIEKASRER